MVEPSDAAKAVLDEFVELQELRLRQRILERASDYALREAAPVITAQAMAKAINREMAALERVADVDRFERSAQFRYETRVVRAGGVYAALGIAASVIVAAVQLGLTYARTDSASFLPLTLTITSLTAALGFVVVVGYAYRRGRRFRAAAQRVDEIRQYLNAWDSLEQELRGAGGGPSGTLYDDISKMETAGLLSRSDYNSIQELLRLRNALVQDSRDVDFDRLSVGLEKIESLRLRLRSSRAAS